MPASYRINQNKKFINPYNFVPVTWKNSSRKDYLAEEGERISGSLDCVLTALTPLSIPEYVRSEVLKPREEKSEAQRSEKKKPEDKHSIYRFFRDPATGEPMIPGSSLRGPIRSVYETVTDSCLVTARTNLQITKRASSRQSGRASLLIREKDVSGKLVWKLYSAERYIVRMDTRDGYKPLPAWVVEGVRFYKRAALEAFGFGSLVYVEPGDIYKNRRNITVGRMARSLSDKRDAAHNVEGYLYLGEIPETGGIQVNKHFESVFVKGAPIAVAITDKDIEKLKALYESYNDAAVNRVKKEDSKWYQGAYDALNRAGAGTVIPLWYNEREHWLSLAGIGRVAFQRTLGDMLYQKKPCEKRDRLCKACALFGMAGDEKLGSRIRITDARMIDGAEYKGDEAVLKELAGPKISYIPFYLKNGGNGVSSYDDTGASLKGRKYYWHDLRSRTDSSCYSAGKKTKRNATMELVEPGKAFRFTVYFDQITKRELDELKWVLTFGQNGINDPENVRYAYKIGHGKPIGLGSAYIRILEENTRFWDGEKLEYHVDTIKDPEIPQDCFSLEASPVRELLAIADVHAAEGREVRYPYVFDDREDAVDHEDEERTTPWSSFHWFSETWQPGRRNGPELLQEIPGILAAADDEHMLHAIEVVPDGGNGGYNGGGNRGGGNYGGGNRGNGNYNGRNNGGGNRGNGNRGGWNNGRRP